MKGLLQWIISSVAVYITAYLLSGVVIESVLVAVITALIIGLINSILKPILFVLTLPINILTLGLFSLITNGLLIMLADFIVPGFEVENFWWALLFSIILSIVTFFLKTIFKPIPTVS